jgi:hypothetical protein
MRILYGAGKKPQVKRGTTNTIANRTVVAPLVLDHVGRGSSNTLSEDRGDMGQVFSVFSTSEQASKMMPAYFTMSVCICTAE